MSNWSISKGRISMVKEIDFGTDRLFKRIETLRGTCRESGTDCPECPCGECEKELGEINRRLQLLDDLAGVALTPLVIKDTQHEY